jgi:DNA-binding CsgD family transcriptional regulator
MSPEQARIALIDSIYEAVLDNDRWPSVLESIADAIGTVQVAVASIDQQANIVAVIAPRIDPELVASWRDYWAFRDPFFARAILRPSGEIYTLDNLISREEFAATPVFSAVWRPANCSLATAATNLVVKDKFCALIGVSNAPGKDFLTEEQLRHFEAITQHVGRAVRISRQLRKLDLANLAAQERFDLLPLSAMLVDAWERVVLINAAAKRMLDAHDGIFLRDGRLTISNVPDAMQKLVSSCARTSQGLGGPGGELIVPRAHVRSPINVIVAPLRSRTRLADVPWIGFGSPVAIVTVSDPDLDRRRREAKLRRRFGLTNAETAFAVEILKGDGRRAAAKRCGITDGTAKTHLAHIFEKTGTNRQAELVRFLLNAADAPSVEFQVPPTW